jgi:surface antigen Omp85-like protein
LKHFACLFFIFMAFAEVNAQQLTLKISGENEAETKVIDSVSYKKKHLDIKSINSAVNQFSEVLTRKGYLQNIISESEKTNDSVFNYKASLGERTRFIFILIPKAIQDENLGENLKSGLLKLNFNETEAFLKTTAAALENRGYALAKIKLDNFFISDKNLFAELVADFGSKRQLNDIVIKGYEKFPEGHLANVKRQYRKKTFSQENPRKINADFEKFRFVRQIKYPEILFTKDTTKVYVYLEKAKPSKFEGFIGFSNDEESDVKLNGYLDLMLVNILNSGEALSLYWKSDGEDQKTFNLGLELPYIFKSRLGLKTSLNIFKQDSTFQNTRTAIDLGYYFDYNTRLYLGYQSAESSDIQNQNTASISDYENSFVTADFEYRDFRVDDFLFPERTRLSLKAGTGSRTSKLNSDSQVFISMDAFHNLYLDENNIISLRTQNYYLKSNNYIINELFRFGGINSVRGFNENSLQGNTLASILTEYRYRITQSLYLHSITDYGYFDDRASDNSGTLFGFGLGFGLLTKNGLLNLVYANGNANHQEIKLSNSIVHISFKTNF